MPIRTTSTPITFHRPFSLPGVDGLQPAGTYTVETDEELIEGLSFYAYRRVATVIRLPAGSGRLGFSQAVSVNPLDLDAAQARDACTDRAS
jgi:hypothetical protein